AQAAERLRLLQELPVLIEDLQPHVAAIGDEQTTPRIEREAVRRTEFAGRGAELAPRLDEFAVLRELRDSCDGVRRGVRVLPAVSFGDEDVTVRRRHDVVGFGERLGRHLRDRKSTRLNSSHVSISYAVFCLKKKIITRNINNS